MWRNEEVGKTEEIMDQISAIVDGDGPGGV